MSGARPTARTEWTTQPAAPPAPFGLAVAVALLAGVLVVQRFATLPPLAASMVATVFGALLWMRPSHWRFAGAAVCGVALACGHGRIALDLRLPESLSGVDARADVRVLGLPRVDVGSVQFDARIEDGAGAAAGLEGRRIRIGWHARPPAMLPTIEAGSRWRLALRLRPPRGLVNPGGYDFERRAVEQRLAATGHVTRPESARLLAAGTGLDRLRERLGERIALALPRERARFVAALALGDTRALTDHDWEVLRATGLTHLIAISGFHVGLVAGFGALLGAAAWRLLPALARRWPRPQGAAAFALLLALAYAAIAGFALPTVRTLLMIAAALAARLARRRQRAQDAFAFALLAVLIVDPLSVLAPGFWLSFLGVAWLICCLPAHSSGQGIVRPFIAAQGVAVLGLMPLTVWFFGQASLAGPLVNLVGIPWISLGVVPLCLVGLAATPFSDDVAGIAWSLAGTLMQWLWIALERVAAWPGSLAWLPEPGLPVLAIALFGALWCLLPHGVPGKFLAAWLMLPLLWPNADRPAQGEADLWLLDTGQGLSMLVRTSRHDLLYDAGPATPGGADLGETTVVPALRALSVATLDRLVVSHGDSDHAGGAAAVIRELAPARTLAPPGWASAAMAPCLAGERWTRDGVEFELLHPPPYFPYQRNESSCVLRIVAGGGTALLPGDIGRHIEARLARLPPARIRTDVLLAPHHGSASSSSLEFLAATRPSIALIAVGRGNRFGLPEPIVLSRYDRYRVNVLDTAGNGAIRIRLGKGGARVVERLRQDRRRWWRDAGPGPTGYASGGSGIER